jgi:hypothetical protein
MMLRFFLFSSAARSAALQVVKLYGGGEVRWLEIWCAVERESDGRVRARERDEARARVCASELSAGDKTSAACERRRRVFNLPLRLVRCIECTASHRNLCVGTVRVSVVGVSECSRAMEAECGSGVWWCDGRGQVRCSVSPRLSDKCARRSGREEAARGLWLGVRQTARTEAGIQRRDRRSAASNAGPPAAETGE